MSARDSPQTTLKLIQNFNISPFHKLALLSISLISLPQFLITLAFIWSHFQILTLLIRTNILCLFSKQTTFSLIPVHFIEKYLFSTNLFNPINLPKLTLAMLILALIYLLTFTFTLLYIFYALHRKLMVPNLLLATWKIFIDIHPLIIFYPLHLNISQLIINFAQSNSFSQSIKVFAYIVLIYNLILTFASTALFHAKLKTKHSFSSKTKTLNLLDLFLKTILPFFIYEKSITTGGKTLIMVLISLYCLFRDQVLLGILPYYRVKALKVASITHAIVTSFVLAAIWAKIFCYAHDWAQYSITVLLWVIFAPILMRLYLTCINNKLLRIILHPYDVRRSYDLVHYWEIYKTFSDFSYNGLGDHKIKRQYFDFTMITGNKEKFTPAASHLKKIELFQDFIKRRPRDSWLVELALARLYTKKESSCILASHIITKHTNRSFFDKISLNLLKLKILSKLQLRLNEKDLQDEQVQIANFIHMQNQYKQLRKDMIQSVDYHLKFWKIFASSKPKFLKMIDFAKRNITLSKKLKSFSSIQSKNFKKSFFPEPLLTCSIYSYFFQDDILMAGNLLKEYFQTQQKIKDTYGSAHKSKNHTQKGFTSDAVYLFVSSQQNKLGEILDCSGRINAAFGYPKEFLIGKSINILIPTIYSRHQDYFLKTYLQQENNLNKTIPISILVQDGYIMPGLIHVSLTYMQDYELCYYLVLEAVKDDTRLVILNSHGAISSCSQNFARDLGFQEYQDKEHLNIQDLCPNFFEEITVVPPNTSIKENFSLEKKFTFKETNPNISISPTQHHHEVYTKEIQQLSFYPFWYAKDRDIYQKLDPVLYQVKIRKLQIKNTEIYEVTLQKISSFNFTVPESLKRRMLPRSIKDILLQSTRISIDPHARIRTETESPFSPYYIKSTDQPLVSPSNRKLFFEGAFSPRSSGTQRLLSPMDLSPKKDHHHQYFDFAPTTTLAMMTEAPILKSEENQPHHRVFPPNNGDFQEEEEEDEEIIPVPQNENFSSIVADNHYHNSKDDQQAEEDSLDGIFGNLQVSTTETTGKLENSKAVERQKIVKKLVRARTHRLETHLYITSFAIACSFLLGLLIWMNFYTSHTSEKVKTYSTALQNSYFRSYWTKITNQDTLYWLGAMIGWADYDPMVLVGGYHKSFLKVSFYNQELEKSINLINPEIRDLHYKRNVKIYDRDIDNNKVLVGYDTTFQASKRLIDRGMTNYQQAVSGYDFQHKINRDSYFIFDNSLNDLQLQAETLIAAIRDRLFEIFDESRQTMVKYIGVTIGMVFLFMLFSGKFLIMANIEFKRFIKILYMLKKPDIKHIENVSLKFKELLEKDCQEKDQFFSLYDSEKRQVKTLRTELQGENNAKRQQQQRENFYNIISLKDSLKRVYIRNLFLFLGLFIFTALTIGFAWIYYHLSSNKLDTMQKQQVNINSALKFVNSLSWITAEFQLISLLNFTIPTRNQPIIDSILFDINQLKDINTLQSSLQNNDGEFSPEMNTILFNFSCSKAYSPYYSYALSVLQPNCEAISNGENRVGLLELTTRISMVLSAAVPALYNGPRDWDSLHDFYNEIWNSYGMMTDIEFVLLLSAYTVAIDDSEDLVEDLATQQVKLAWIAAIFSLLLAVFTWIFIMRKIAKLDFESREIMSFVPSRLLLKIPQLKRYLVLTARANDTRAQSLLR